MVHIGSEKYAIPLSSISEIVNVQPEEIRMVREQEVILLRDMVIPVVRLNKILEVPDSLEDQKNITCVIVKKGDKLSAFLVDSLSDSRRLLLNL